MDVKFNDKQKKLLYLVRNRSWYKENLEFRDLKKKLFNTEIITTDSSINIDRRSAILNVKNISNVNVGAINTPLKFAREQFGFVPTQISNYIKFIKEIEKYQTDSIIITYDIDQKEDQYNRLIHCPASGAEHISKVSKGIIWITFYDNDKKMVVYEFSPHVFIPSLTYEVKNNLNYDRDIPLRFSTSCYSVRTFKQGGNVRTFNLNGLNDEEMIIGRRYYYLYTDSIQAKKFEAISNLNINGMCIFKEELI